MKKERKVVCPRCGGGSFRYLRKENKSYCLKCGFAVEQSFFEQ